MPRTEIGRFRMLSTHTTSKWLELIHKTHLLIPSGDITVSCLHQRRHEYPSARIASWQPICTHDGIITYHDLLRHDNQSSSVVMTALLLSGRHNPSTPMALWQHVYTYGVIITDLHIWLYDNKSTHIASYPPINSYGDMTTHQLLWRYDLSTLIAPWLLIYTFVVMTTHLQYASWSPICSYDDMITYLHLWCHNYPSTLMAPCPPIFTSCVMTTYLVLWAPWSRTDTVASWPPIYSYGVMTTNLHYGVKTTSLHIWPHGLISTTKI